MKLEVGQRFMRQDMNPVKIIEITNKWIIFRSGNKAKRLRPERFKQKHRIQ